jgi:ribosomal protein S18 acetylase RimI-like enzyme
MQDVRIEPLEESRIIECVDVLSQAYVTNPIFIAIFGGHNLEKTKRFFRISMEFLRGEKLAVISEDQIVGVVHWVESPACYPSLREKVLLLPRLLLSLGLATSRLLRWTSAWSRAEPDDQHCHLSPIAVLPEWQGRGIGKLMMKRYCEHMDSAAKLGYLETDRPENVGFYSKFDFEVIEELPVLGVPTWLMRRPPDIGKS